MVHLCWESARYNVTWSGEEEISLTQGALRDQPNDAPWFEQFYALIRERKGQDVGVLQEDISTLESSVTFQLSSIDRNMGTIIFIIYYPNVSRHVGCDKPQPVVTQPPEVGVTGNQPAVVGSQCGTLVSLGIDQCLKIVSIPHQSV